MCKKILSVVLSIAMLLSFATVGTAAEQNDDAATRGEVVMMLLNAADDYNPDVQKTDIIKGYEDGQLHEERGVTRAEALVMLKRAFGEFPELKGHNLRVAIPMDNFTDIPDWAKDELAPVFNAGIVAGTAPGIFSPDDAVTTEQMKLFISRVYALYGSNLEDNFYMTVNKSALETMEIPEGETSAGTLYDVVDITDEQISEIIREAASSNPEKGSPEEKINLLYNSIIDMDARNKAGYEPIKKDLEAIAAIKSVSDLADVRVYNGFMSAAEILVSFDVTVDMEDNNTYIPELSVAAPRRAKEVYSGEAEAVKNAYIKCLTTFLTLCGQSEEEAEKNANAFFEFEKPIADKSLTPAEEYDPSKTYNIYTLDELKDIFKTVDIEQIFDENNLEGKSKIMVSDVERMKQVASMLTDDNIEAIKNYLTISTIADNANLLSEDFRNANILFAQEAYGIEGSQTLEEEAATVVSESLADYIGQIYAEKYCSPEMVEDITGIINDVIDVYRKRIQNITWMSDATKEKALLKLDTLIINVGAPDYEKEPSYLDNAEIKGGGSYYEYILEIAKASWEDDVRLLREPVDKTQWITSPQTVNAFYHPVFNSINFPAAFMQGAVYDVDFSYEEKLGKAGYVIAHEITHAFDADGSQYDENGSIADWWTAEEKAAFAELSADVVAFFDGQESAPGIAMDGELTLSENIADMGALSCVTEIGKNTGNFDLKKMYESTAELWTQTTTREVCQQLAYVDVHSASMVRINRVLQTVDEFYEVFEIGENDGMYVAPENRVKIW